MAKQGSRKTFLDLLRIIACFFVIVNHTNSDVFRSVTPDRLTWYISIAYFFACKIAVPIFIMITGYLLLDKKDTWKKCFDRTIRIVGALVFCAVIYTAYRLIVGYPDVVLKDLFERMFKVYMLSPTNAAWYLYAYIGILLMLPFLQKMASQMEKKDYHIFFIISGFFIGTVPILNHYFEFIALNKYFELPLFGGYICMLFIGQYFARFEIKRTTPRFFLALFVFVAMIAFNVIATHFEYIESSKNFLFFDNRTFLPIVTESVCVFYMASFINLPEKLSKAISYIGACTFGIYLISDMTIKILKPYHLILAEEIHPLLAVVIFEIAVFLIGLLVTSILRKLPIIKKIL